VTNLKLYVHHIKEEKETMTELLKYRAAYLTVEELMLINCIHTLISMWQA